MLNETTIDLLDMLRRLCIKRRIIFAGILAAMILTNIYAIVQNKKDILAMQQRKQEQEKLMQSIQDSSTINLEEYENALTERESKDVKYAVDSYLSFKKKYQEYQNYMDSSIKMRIDPNNESVMELAFTVDNHFEITYPDIHDVNNMCDILTSYQTKLKSEDIYRKITEKNNWDMEYSYIDELITISDNNSQTVKITISADSKETCEAIAEEMIKAVEGITPGIKSIFGEFDVTFLETEYYVRADRTILTDQQSIINNMNALRSNMLAVPNALSEEQKKYYYALVDQQEKIEIESGNPDEDSYEEIIVPKMVYLNWKYMFLGAIGAVFIVCGVIVVRYLFTEKLRVYTDMPETFRIPIIESLFVTKEKDSRINLLINRLFLRKICQASKEQHIDMIIAQLNVLVNKKGIKSLYLASSCEDDSLTSIMQEVVTKMQEKGIKISCGDNIDTKVECYNAMVQADSVVLFERVDVSGYRDIQREKDLCNKAGVEVLGAVVLI